MPLTIVLVSQLPGLLLVVVGPGPIILSILLLLLLPWITWILMLILIIGVLLVLSLLDSFNLAPLLFFTLKSNPGSKVASLVVMSMSVITLLALLSWQSTQQVAGIGK